MKAFIYLTVLMMGTTVMGNGRLTENFNRGWMFNLGDVPEAKFAGFDDSGWRAVRVPHDWSVELSFTQENAGGCTAFLPGGIGWYRKTFTVPESAKGKLVRIEFDGVYNNSDVWINGHHLGHRPYGYSPFSYEISECLKYGGENTVAVRADRSAYMDCRWYPGSGIYRDVKLVTFDPVHIPQWGVFVTTKGDTVTVKTSVKNGSQKDAVITLKTGIHDADGKTAANLSSELTLKAGELKEVEQVFQLKDLKRWDTETPYLYSADVQLLNGDVVADQLAVNFGVRDILYDPETGFYLNGKNTLLKGVCLHHDGGCVGAAVPDGVWERRLRYLKEAGCNAIRTAHNPPSEAFLDLCDRMGFLVQDESLDEWDNPKDKKNNYNQTTADERTRGYSEQFREWGARDTQAMVLRDRNHPSIIMWSIGNEIEWTYPGYADATGYWIDENKGKIDYYWDEPPFSDAELKARFEIFKKRQGEHILADAAAKLSEAIKAVDTSRPVTANLVMPSVSHFSGYADALDIVGYSYRTVNYDWGRKHYPEKMILGTENWVQWPEWKAVLDRPAIPGIFLWTGINYLGESQNWPQKASGSGMLDTAGFRKPNYWFFKTFWKEDEPMMYIATQRLADSNYLLKDGTVVENPSNQRTRKWGWPDLNNHWNYADGETVYIELYSNCETTELFLNGKSLGAKKLSDHEDRLLKWAVPFAGGELEAVGKNGGEMVASQTLNTAGEPVSIKLTTDKTELNIGGEDIVHFEAQLEDSEGRAVKHFNREIRFAIEGDAENIGVDNGSPKSSQDFQSDVCTTEDGRCLMVLRSGGSAGTVKVIALGDGLKSGSVVLNQK